jgi:protein transport protein SEC23
VFLKTALTQAIGLVPANSLVGLITYGTQVHVHELGFAECPKSYVFRGSKDVTREQILDQLGLTAPGALQRGPQQPIGVLAGARDGIPASSINRFLLPASDCEFTLTSVRSLSFLASFVVTCA